MSTVQIRVDAKMKAQARDVFKKMGLDLSSGIHLYLARVVQDGSIPFVLRTKNGYTPQQEQEMIRETQWAKKNAKKYSSVDALMAEYFKNK